MKKLQLNWVEKVIMMKAFHKMQAKPKTLPVIKMWSLEHDEHISKTEV